MITLINWIDLCVHAPIYFVLLWYFQNLNFVLIRILVGEVLSFCWAFVKPLLHPVLLHFINKILGWTFVKSEKSSRIKNISASFGGFLYIEQFLVFTISKKIDMIGYPRVWKPNRNSFWSKSTILQETNLSFQKMLGAFGVESNLLFRLFAAKSWNEAPFWKNWTKDPSFKA